MVDASYGQGPSNSSISKYQCSGLVLSGIQFSTFYNVPISGQGQSLSGSVTGLLSGLSGSTGYTVTCQYGALSGLYVANTPTSESSWNV